MIILNIIMLINFRELNFYFLIDIYLKTDLFIYFFTVVERKRGPIY